MIVTFPTKMNLFVLIVVSYRRTLTRITNIWLSKFIAFNCNWRYQCLWSTKRAMILHLPVPYGIKLIRTRPWMAMVLVNWWESCCANVKCFKSFIKVNWSADNLLISWWPRNIQMGWFRKSWGGSGSNWIASSTNWSSLKFINEASTLTGKKKRLKN